MKVLSLLQKNAEAMKKPQNVQDSTTSASRTSADNVQRHIRQRSLTAGEQFLTSNELKAQVAQKEQEIEHLKREQDAAVQETASSRAEPNKQNVCLHIMHIQLYQEHVHTLINYFFKGYG